MIFQKTAAIAMIQAILKGIQTTMKATRFTACLLALLMTVSCGSGTVGTPSDSTDDKSSSDSDDITEVELKPDIPDDLTFDDRTINILTWNHYETVEFTTESENPCRSHQGWCN